MSTVEDADFIFENTCSIRENAENKIWHRLKYFGSLRRKRHSLYPKVGILGCMAERLKDKLLEEGSVDLVVGPDGYRGIPAMMESVIKQGGEKLSCVDFSFDEHYADILPTRSPGEISAYISIMRGCNNMCSFCIVPFTRGREKSRDFQSIVSEIRLLVATQGVKEVLLLGQNVNGYHDASAEAAALFPTRIHYRTSSEGFSNVFNSRQRSAPGARFSDLLAAVAEIDPELRVRFTSPHPKDFPPDVLQAIAAYPNLCSSLHMPLQSGSNAMLQKMRRGYSREAFLELVDAARETIPRVTISTDVIAGFCGETEEDHRDTLDIMSRVRFDQAFMFAYSLRDKTHAARVFVDDVPEDVKLRRLQEIIDMFRTRAIEKNRATETNRVHLVLVEGLSQRQAAKDCAGAASCQWTGRTDGNKRVVFSIVSGADGLPMMPRFDVASTELEQLADLDAIAARLLRDSGPQRSVSTDTLRGTYVAVKILEANGTTLRGVALGGSSIADWNQSRRFST